MYQHALRPAVLAVLCFVLLFPALGVGSADSSDAGGLKYSSAESMVISATRTIHGAVFRYSHFPDGREALEVEGALSMDFDVEEVMKQFRSSLHLPETGSSNYIHTVIHNASQGKEMSAPLLIDPTPCPTKPSTDQQDCARQVWPEEEVDDSSAEKPRQEPKRSLLDSLAKLVSNSPFSSIQQYLSYYSSSYQRKDREAELKQAQEEIAEIKDDLAKITTQELVMRSRQAELGRYLTQQLQMPQEERMSSVEELVQLEDDRLALLEHRLKRMRRTLQKQLGELENFVDSFNVQFPGEKVPAGQDEPAEKHLFVFGSDE